MFKLFKFQLFKFIIRVAFWGIKEGGAGEQLNGAGETKNTHHTPCLLFLRGRDPTVGLDFPELQSVSNSSTEITVDLPWLVLQKNIPTDGTTEEVQRQVTDFQSARN